jgi:hypothetical protein
MAGIAALVMVAFGLRQLRLLREQNRSRQRASAAAVEAADAARAAVTETARTRAGTFAPRITVLPEKPQWPPLISRHASRGRPSVFLGHRARRRALGCEELSFPESAGHLMWFVVRSVLTNEGASTARVRIMGDGELIEGETCPSAKCCRLQLWRGLLVPDAHPASWAVSPHSVGHSHESCRVDRQP